MPVFGLQPQAISTPGGLAQGFSSLGQAFLGAGQKERELALQQRSIEYQHAFQQQQLQQQADIANQHNQTQKDIWAGRGNVSIQNTDTRAGATVEAAGKRADATTGAAETRAGASRYSADKRYQAAHEKMVNENGYDPHDEIDKAADQAIKGMPKTKANPAAATNPLAAPTLPIEMGEQLNQLNQIETWRAQQHAAIDNQVRAKVDNAGDPQPDKPAPVQGFGSPNVSPAVQSPQPVPGVPGASGARPNAQGAAAAFQNPAPQAPKTGGKSLPRAALQARVKRGDFPDEAAAAADAQAHGFSISDN